MREIKFRAWHKKEKKLYFRAYQKVTHVLLCGDDRGQNDGKGVPQKRASYEDCIFLESTGLTDKKGREIYEGDILRIYSRQIIFDGTLHSVPDMFRSRKLHPLHDLLAQYGIKGDDEDLEFEVIGHHYEKNMGYTSG
ncbi:MAG TPA: YopX family protein [bacterium]|nr:YopX family protein [bacterium]